MAARGILHGRFEARMFRRASKASSALPLNRLSTAYKAGLNILT